VCTLSQNHLSNIQPQHPSSARIRASYTSLFSTEDFADLRRDCVSAGEAKGSVDVRIKEESDSIDPLKGIRCRQARSKREVQLHGA
jgi:hypothetical protein